MSKKVAINGFGRIGRCVARNIIKYHPEIEIVAINCFGVDDVKYMMKYDTVHGRFDGKVEGNGKDELVVNGKKINLQRETDLNKLEFAKHGADAVFECTGVFLTQEKCQPYINNGVGKVLISAPAKDDTPTFVMGVNHTEYAGQKIVSNASCTTNCLAPLMKVLLDNFGIEKALMNTVHAYTSTQTLVDSLSEGRGRAAAENLVPTSTGAAKAISLVLPALKGIVDGQSLRTPLANVSMVDLTALLKKDVTVAEITQAYEKALTGPLAGQLDIDYEGCVSSDFKGRTHSCILAKDLTQVVSGNMVKVLAWYDNEWGYSHQLTRLAKHILGA